LEFRLLEPIAVFYTEHHPRKSEDELDEVQLKVQEVKTLGEAFSLERDILTQWAQRVQEGGYISIPWPVDLGSPSQQVFAKLLAKHGLVEMVTSHEKPVMPKKERDDIDLPPIISKEWLGAWLAKVLGVLHKAPTEESIWYSTNITYRPDTVQDLSSIHGESGVQEYVKQLAAEVKLKYDSMAKDSVEAVGLKSDFMDKEHRLVVHFQLRQPEQVQHEKPVMPKKEREKLDLPDVVSAPWLAQYLGKVLGLPVALVTESSEWHQAQLRWIPEDVSQLMAFHGLDVKREVLTQITVLAKRIYDAMPKASVEAIGAKVLEEDRSQRIGVFFKMKKSEQALDEYLSGSLAREYQRLQRDFFTSSSPAPVELKGSLDELWSNMNQQERESVIVPILMSGPVHEYRRLQRAYAAGHGEHIYEEDKEKIKFKMAQLCSIMSEEERAQVEHE